MANKGADPIDLTSDVGTLRANIGDTQGVALAPPEAGFLDYAWFSDAELEAFLALSSDSVTRATGYAIMQLSLGAAATGVSIRTDDLAVDNKSRGDSLLAIAKWWFAQADAEDALVDGEFFEVVPFVGSFPECEPVYPYARWPY